MSARDSLTNSLREGGGFDDLTQVSHSFEDDYNQNFDDNGVWRLRIEAFVPQYALALGTEVYLDNLRNTHPQWDEATIQDAFDLTTLQMGPNRATIYNRDATHGDYRPDRCAYIYYTLLRAPEVHGEYCDADYVGAAGEPKLDNYCMQSEPFEKRYGIVMVSNGGEVFPVLE